jgi:BirA family biotin operon repressor/biotin-[acetyl-CoA-carboxylase] ligase
VDRAELPGVAALEVHRSLSSTNDRAREWVREGVSPVAVVVAGEQTAGRGRGGRRWVSRAGHGLWMSVIVGSGGPGPTPLLPVRVGLSLARRLEALPGRTGETGVRLKWPNDLLCESGKFGGILCEAIRDRVVVGVGINCRLPEVDADYPVGALAGIEPASLVPVVTAAVLEASARREAYLDDAELTEWRRRDVLVGGEVMLDGGGLGTARGIDARGRLLLTQEGGGTRAVVAGSVRPVRPLRTEAG